MAHSGWFLVTSRWTQKVVEYGNLPKVPSIQPGKKEILIDRIQNLDFLQ